MLRVGIFTDNDFEKVNGVTTSLRAAVEHAPADLHLRVYTCNATGADEPTYLAIRAHGIGIPFYSEMKMYVPPVRALLRHAAADRLDVIHLTTPGPVGLAAMYVASKLQLPMVGSFHTHLAEYTTRLSGSRRLGQLMQQYMRWPYGKCRQILTPSESTRQVLIDAKIDPAKLRLWERGVSTARFDPARRSERLRAEWGVSERRPAVLYVGRLSVEKGLREMGAVRRSLEARSIAHRFVFVGDGPMRGELERLAPDAVFTGNRTPDEVAVAMASADLFVFPSRTDTFGLVLLEALACGVPIAAFPVAGPIDAVTDPRAGILDDDLRAACLKALTLSPRAARAYALRHSWRASAECFLENLAPRH